MPCFRIGSSCCSHRQAPLCHCTLWVISNHPEGTFGRLRYSLGGDRPSQTTHLALSFPLEPRKCKGGIPLLRSPSPTYSLHPSPRPNARL
jgi:hypothetical protein